VYLFPLGRKICSNCRFYTFQYRYIFPAAVADALVAPENHLAYFTDEVIDALDLRAFYQDH